MKSALAIANAMMGLLFVTGAALQFNDPDPWRWIAIYSLAALACGSAGRASWSKWVAAGAASASLLWAASLALQMHYWVSPRQMLEPMHAYGGAVELAREMWGLVIIGMWMLLLARRGVDLLGRDAAPVHRSDP